VRLASEGAKRKFKLLVIGCERYVFFLLLFVVVVVAVLNLWLVVAGLSDETIIEGLKMLFGDGWGLAGGGTAFKLMKIDEIVLVNVNHWCVIMNQLEPSGKRFKTL
jgi:hypothetical protein